MSVLSGMKPIQTSFLIHALIMGIFILFVNLDFSMDETIEVPIEIVAPKEAQNLTQIQEKPKVVLKSVNEPVPSDKPVREVFGASRNTLTDESLGDEGVDAKKGNTLSKEVDSTVLSDSDVDSLPTPTEEYLVSVMPSVLSEVRPEYPKEAKDKGLEGAVVMDILIDAEGKVRDAVIIEGPEIFKSGALEAIKKFSFSPAKVDNSAVAVRIRYTLRFELEY
jgi:protein TonB